MQKHTFHRDKTGQFSKLAKTLSYQQETLSTLITAPFSLQNIGQQIQKKQANYSREIRKTLVHELKKQYLDLDKYSPVSLNIEKLSDENTFTITTGHQLNIATGPAYVIYKILHCINLAEALKKTYPLNNFVPVFWLASEDHDIEEVNHTTLFGKKIQWNENQGGAVGQYVLHQWEEMKASVASFFQNNPASEIHRLLTSYAGANLGEATKNLYHVLFERFGLVIIEPNVPGLKSLFANTMAREASQPFVEECVQKKNSILEQLGFTPQAFARPINLFRLSTGKRERLLEVDKVAITHEILNNPASFSPNVMLRPAYQETILPNLVYVGGGGELSYWIQQKGIFEAIGLEFPLLSVRNSVQILDQSMQKKCEKLELTWEDIFNSTQELQRKYMLKHTGEELNFSGIDFAVNELNQQLSRQAVFFDQNIEKFVEAEISKLHKQIEAIKGKFTKFQKSKFDLVMKQIEDFKLKLFPNNQLQERTESFLSFCKDGNISSRLDQVKVAMDPFENDLIILLLD